MELFLSAYISYFVIIDPVGVSLIFTGLTRGKKKEYIKRMANRSIFISVCLTFIFGFFGEPFLGSLGIAIDSFRIAGGLLLFFTAFTMVTKSELFPLDSTGEEDVDISVYPMAIPLMSGPGCLTLTVLLFSNAGQQSRGVLFVTAAVFAIFATTFVCFHMADKITALIGKTGNDILKRLLGVLLAALSIQFIADGIKGFIV